MTKIRRLLATSGVALALAGGLAATAFAQEGQERQEICHIAGGGYVLIEVAEPAVQAHMLHGDVMPDEYGECPGGGSGPGQWFVSALVQFFQWLFEWLSQGWHGFNPQQLSN